MIKLLLKVLTFGLYDPNEQRRQEAEHEIDLLKDKARQFDALHLESGPYHSEDRPHAST